MYRNQIENLEHQLKLFVDDLVTYHETFDIELMKKCFTEPYMFSPKR